MSKRPCANPSCTSLVDAWSDRKYCSDKCRQKCYRDRKRGKKDQYSINVTRFCKNCGQKFTTKKPSQLFCKESHRVSYYQQMKRLDQQETK